ncbi:MAG: hypothetical protein JSV62_00595 [Promethearchaeota archaeon]|nr:MAG: hypothetical protein JSV62_00595 [Candidatus Lokiarchaeota archaeon]
MEHKKGVILCIIGGALMLISSLTGRVGFLGTILSLLSGYVGPEIQVVIEIILNVFSFIAMGGGISVIIGALIAGFSSDFAGRLIIGIGIGSSLISLIILLITSIYGGTAINDLPLILLNTFNGIYGLVGAILAIFARRLLKD